MGELLTSLKAVAKAFLEIFVLGLVNFENPVLSIIDYALWGPIIITFLTKLIKNRR